MARFDMKYVNDALDISSGDIVIVQSDQRHIEDTIIADKGWWKEFPVDGVGVRKWLGGATDVQKAQREIKINLLADNYNSTPVVINSTSGNMTINPNVTI